MSGPDYMRQCTLRRRVDRETQTIVSWIPERYAQLRKSLRLMGEDGSWTSGWVVESVGETRLATREVHERSRDHLKQRKASDI